MRNKRVITTDGVLRALEAGGQIQYRPNIRNNKREWALWARYPDEEFVHVISSKTGEPRVFKTSDAVVGFHLRVFPDSECVIVPVKIDTTHEWSGTESAAQDEDFNDTE